MCIKFSTLMTNSLQLLLSTFQYDIARNDVILKFNFYVCHQGADDTGNYISYSIYTYYSL